MSHSECVIGDSECESVNPPDGVPGVNRLICVESDIITRTRNSESVYPRRSRSSPGVSHQSWGASEWSMAGLERLPSPGTSIHTGTVTARAGMLQVLDKVYTVTTCWKLAIR